MKRCQDDSVDKMKRDLILFVVETFHPIHQDGEDKTYLFYVKKDEWCFKYDKGIKCWIFFIDNNIVMSLYDDDAKDAGSYINEHGNVEELSRNIEWIENDLHRAEFEFDSVKAELLNVAKQQRIGKRDIVYPNHKRWGEISRKNYNHAIYPADRGKIWSLRFTQDHIPHITKEPVPAPLTAREYFRLCHKYYKLNPHKYDNVPADPIEAFLKIADHRTHSVTEVNLDDPQDFCDWTNKTGRWKGRWSIGHEFEIAGRIKFYPCFTDGVNGYFEWHAFIWTYFSVAEFCKEPNVVLADREFLPDIINELDMMRVEPGIVNRAYGYPNKDYSEPVSYLEYLNLKQKRRIKWDELFESQVKRKLCS